MKFDLVDNVFQAILDYAVIMCLKPNKQEMNFRMRSSGHSQMCLCFILEQQQASGGFDVAKLAFKEEISEGMFVE